MRKAIVCILTLCVLLAHVPCMGEEMDRIAALDRGEKHDWY